MNYILLIRRRKQLIIEYTEYKKTQTIIEEEHRLSRVEYAIEQLGGIPSSIASSFSGSDIQVKGLDI